MLYLLLTFMNKSIIFLSDLEGLNKGPQKIPDPLWTIEQFDETQHTEQTEEGDGDFNIFLIL